MVLTDLVTLPPIPDDIIKALKDCKPESIADVFPESDPKTFSAFDETMLANLIIGSGRRRVTIIKDIPLTKAIEMTAHGRICRFSVLGNFRGVDKLIMSDGTVIDPPTFYNCMNPIAATPLPNEEIIVDAYFCDTRTLIALSRSQEMYY